MSADVHQGDVGTVLRATILDEDRAVVDISAATVKTLWLKKPDATVLEKAATLSSDGTDGRMEYTTLVGDLDQAGEWQMQGYVEVGGGKWRSDIHRFSVQANLS